MSEWLEFYKSEPFGDIRADIRSGVIAATVQNVHGGLDGKAASPADFMLFTEPDPGRREVILDDDPDTQSALILAGVFGVDPSCLTAN